MKISKLFILAISVIMFAFVGCQKGNDDKTENNQTPRSDLNVVEEGNTMVATWTQLTDDGVIVKNHLTVVFGDDTLCVSAILIGTFPSETMAQDRYNQIREEGTFDISLFQIDGKSITFDMTESFRGRTKQEVRNGIDRMAEVDTNDGK